MNLMATDLRHWEPSQRRRVSLTILVGTIAVLGVAVVISLLAPDGAQLVLLALTLAVIVLLVVELLVFATGLSEPAPGNISGTESIPPRPAGWELITLKCGNCGTIFDVEDTGVRPLHHTCPGCGAEGVLREEERGPPASPARERAPEPARPASEKQLRLRCKACATIFKIADTGERPLRHRCPGCGAAGIVR